MCLLWLLLQFIVLVMYWDVPPVGSDEEGLLLEMKGEEPREEEAPLMGPDEEPTPSYEAVGCSPPEGRPDGGGPAASSPFTHFSPGRGETGGSWFQAVGFALVETRFESILGHKLEK